MLQNARVAGFAVSELFRENQQEGGGGGGVVKIGGGEFSDPGFKSYSVQLSIATSKNPSMVNTISICPFRCTHLIPVRDFT